VFYSWVLRRVVIACYQLYAERAGHCCILGSRVGVGVHGRATVIAGLGAQLALGGFVAVDLAQPDDR
jgi:hypothetical protein